MPLDVDILDLESRLTSNTGASPDILFREHTPLEEYLVAGRLVFVKREDLYGILPAPPLGKLRGLRLLLQQLYGEGVRLVGCWDTRASKLGQGVAAVCREFSNFNCIVSYPTCKGAIEPAPVRAAADLGAEVRPVPGGRITVSFARAREIVAARGGVMLPFGLECMAAVEGVAREAATLPTEVVEGGTLVVCCGSGVTLAGLLRGLPGRPSRIVGLSSGRSVDNIKACLRRYSDTLPASLEVLPPVTAYAEAIDFPCPFPTHPNYDLKAWRHLVESLENLPDPVLFWNIGA